MQFGKKFMNQEIIFLILRIEKKQRIKHYFILVKIIKYYLHLYEDEDVMSIKVTMKKTRKIFPQLALKKLYTTENLLSNRCFDFLLILVKYIY